MQQNAQGFLLLTLSEVEASLPASLNAPPTLTSNLALECVTIPVAQSGERDVWLVMRIGGYELPLSPTQVVKHHRLSHTFTFVSSDLSPQTAEWSIRVQHPRNEIESQDLETFEVILAQYAAMEESPNNSTSQLSIPTPSSSSLPESVMTWSDSNLKGKLVLVDEQDGKVVGTLGEQYRIKEDETLHARGKEKLPVVIDIPEGENAGQEVIAHPIDYYEKDWIMKSASLISRGMVFATGAVTTGISAASSYYIAHTKPNEKPLEFSESTRGHIRRVHKISGQAVSVSSKTTALIGECIDRAVGYLSGSSGRRSASRPPSPSPVTAAHGSSRSPSPMSSPSPPVLPPRNLNSYLTPPPRTVADGSTSPPLPPRPRLRNRVLLSTDLLLTTLENSAKHLVDHGSTKLGEALGHKYGKDVGDTTQLVGQSVKNVGLVYIDAKGVGRRALLRKAGKKFIKAKLGNKDVVLGVDEQGKVAPPRSSR